MRFFTDDFFFGHWHVAIALCAERFEWAFAINVAREYSDFLPIVFLERRAVHSAAKDWRGGF